MHPAPTTSLGQAIAAIIATLIAAIAEHAREHPMLAGGCRASIRQLEKLSRQLQAMVAEWEATRCSEHAGPAARPPRRARSIRMHPPRRGQAMPSLRRAIAMRNPASAARAPPMPEIRLAPRRTPPDSRRTGAAPAYACA